MPSALALLCFLALSAPPPEAPSPAEPPDDPPRGEAIGDQIVVTAAGVEGRLGDTAAAVTVLDAEELAALPAPTLDEALRQVPGFTLFRRSGSRTANPTIQGASLRGIGGSGAGRALVLADGVPIGDPFGGWVPWGLVPRAALERVEVLRGGASDLYGSAALAGVVQLLRREPADGARVLDLAAGGDGDGRATASGSLWLSGRLGNAPGNDPGDDDKPGPWAAALALQGFSTDGHVPVAPESRGPVDVPVDSTHGSAEATLERRTAVDRGLVLRAGLFDEERGNGTREEINERRIRHASLTADAQLGGGTAVGRLWGSDQDFFQNFTAVAADRASERLVREQRIPSDRLGASGRWIGAGSTATLGGGTTRGDGGDGGDRGNRGDGLSLDRRTVIGLEAERLRGASDERLFLPGRTLDTTVGGTQEELAAFVEELMAIGPRLSLAASLRWDRWTNRPRAGDGTVRREEAWSPRLAVTWRARPDWAVSASAYRSFRAPTLNELYRGFRVGDVVTDPNPELEAERLTGAEVGAAWTRDRRPGSAGPDALRLRTTGFWMRLDDPVTNLTVSTPPPGEDGLIRRRRENLGRTRSTGLEVEAEARWRGAPDGVGWRLTGSWLLADATVERFPADPSLEGRRVPQVPESQATVQLLGSGPRWDASLAVAWSSDAFDDDRNRFRLDGFVLADLRLAWRLGSDSGPGSGSDSGSRVALTFAVDNLLDEDVTVGRTPLRTVGPPRLFLVGLRWESPGTGRP